MKFTTNTSVLPLLDVGLYGSVILDALPDDMTEEEWTEFKQLICETAEEVINDTIGHIIEVKVLSFESPKYYNFENDWLDLEISIDDEDLYLLNVVMKSDENGFFKWAEENFGHRSGFYSFMPFNKKLWEESDEEWRKLSMMVQFLYKDTLEKCQQNYEWGIMESNLFNELMSRGEEDYE